MKKHIRRAPDARQTKEWGKYLEHLGWKIEHIDGVYAFIKALPFVKASFIKIQHPLGPVPFQKIDETAQRHNALWVVIEPHIVGYSESDFQKNGYHKSKILQTHTATIKIDLTQNKHELFRSFSENARRNINKSKKQNLEIKPVFMKDKKNWKYFDIFYSLLTNVGKMKKFYVPDYGEYTAKMKAFMDTSVLIFAYENGKPIAVVWYVYFANVLAYFQTGITERGYETLANYLLVWEGLLLGKKRACSVFDFESIFDERFPKSVPQYKNYTEFKKRFHGDLVRYPSPWIKHFSFWGRLLYKGATL